MVTAKAENLESGGEFSGSLTQNPKRLGTKDTTFRHIEQNLHGYVTTVFPGKSENVSVQLTASLPTFPLFSIH